MVTEIIIKLDDKSEESIKTNKDYDQVDVSHYARFYNEGCVSWTKDSHYNLMFLKSQEQFANGKLRMQGYLFLNEVYDMLSIPRSAIGQIVGWVYNEKNPIGDNFVDFGIYASHNQNFINGYTATALLDFNVDGVILDEI